jgi:hypothetical protein
MMKQLLCVCLLAFSACAARAEAPLVVHEWGTFTSLQDEEGKAIGGINTDDEPVPNFVHCFGTRLLIPPNAPLPNFAKGVPRCHPDVTMRLETPVLYFYPSAGWKPQPVDVHVAFRGGWLTEFYPDAVSKVPGNDAGTIGHIKSNISGELTWKNLMLGAEGTGPETTEKVWLAPRDVKSATVKTANGENEKFLFYRGVGNVNAPLRIVRNEADKTLEVRDNHPILSMLNAEDNLRISAAWLVDVRPDGTCAFKPLGKLEWGKGIRATMPSTLNADGFSATNMLRLKNEMRRALIAEGLFTDEADALLKTWEVSYFKNPGLRFFYLCPREDIDGALPLEISVPDKTTRVMIGRIEIVTPEQRALLRKIAAGPAPNLTTQEAVQKSEIYADYLKLGRFRNALILDEQKRRPTLALNDFISKNGLEAYKVE